MAAHLDEHERSHGNKPNGKGTKTLKTSDGMVSISTPQALCLQQHKFQRIY